MFNTRLQLCVKILFFQDFSFVCSEIGHKESLAQHRNVTSFWVTRLLLTGKCQVCECVHLRYGNELKNLNFYKIYKFPSTLPLFFLSPQKQSFKYIERDWGGMEGWRYSLFNPSKIKGGLGHGKNNVYFFIFIVGEFAKAHSLAELTCFTSIYLKWNRTWHFVLSSWPEDHYPWRRGLSWRTHELNTKTLKAFARGFVVLTLVFLFCMFLSIHPLIVNWFCGTKVASLFTDHVRNASLLWAKKQLAMSWCMHEH